MIDARGPRWSAGLTAIVLVIALITRSPIVIALQLVQFGIGAFAGPPKSPHTWPLFTIATAFALFAAFLNSAFGYCLGCKMYLLGVRLRRG